MSVELKWSIIYFNTLIRITLLKLLLLQLWGNTFLASIRGRKCMIRKCGEIIIDYHMTSNDSLVQRDFNDAKWSNVEFYSKNQHATPVVYYNTILFLDGEFTAKLTDFHCVDMKESRSAVDSFMVLFTMRFVKQKKPILAEFLGEYCTHWIKKKW